MDRLFRLTKLGREYVSGATQARRDRLLDYLYENKVSSAGELATVVGPDRYRILSELRDLKRKGLVKEVTEEG